MKRSSSSLLVIDQEPFRREASSACFRILRDLEKARAEWTRYAEQDEPAYNRWVSSTFGPLLTEKRELNEKLQTRLLLVEEIESERRFRNRSRRSAYRTVMRRRNVWNRARSRLDETFPGEPEYEQAPLEEAPVSARIKEKYRWLVRRLHPDTRKEKRPDLLALWHEVQQAYFERDLDRLETLAALVEVREGLLGEQTGLFRARAALSEMKSALHALNRSLAEARLEIMWGFSLATVEERDKLYVRVGVKLRTEIECAKSDLARVETSLRSWSRPPSGRRMAFAFQRRRAVRG